MSWEVWAVKAPDDTIIADSSFKTERRAWEVVLGWPDEEEIEFEKKRGYRAMRVRIEEIK